MSDGTSAGNEPDAAGRLFRFPPFTFDAAAGLVRRGDEETPLPPKAAQVLEMLLARPGELVTKEELLGAVWHDTAVTEFSLTSAIKTLRNVLGDDARDPAYIQTLHRRGYRFIGTVEVGGVEKGQAAERGPAAGQYAGTEKGPGGEKAPAGDNIAASPAVRRAGDRSADQQVVHAAAEEDRAAMMRMAAAAVLALIALVAWVVWPKETSNLADPAGDAGTENLAEPVGEADRSPAFGLVVLPLVEPGATVAQQRFADGVGEFLAMRLAEVTGGVVPPSVASNFDRTDKSWSQIVDHFDARFILELSVRWSTGPEGTYRIVARLLRAADAEQIWPYKGEPRASDATQMFDEPARIAAEVIAQMGVTMPLGSRQITTAWPTGNLEAWNEYLLGMEKQRASIYEMSAWAEAVDHFDKAVEIDPDFVVARAMLSVSLSQIQNLERKQRGGEIARQLMEEHPDLPQARWARGAFFYNAARDSGIALGEDPESVDRQRYFELAARDLEVARRALPYQPDIEATLAFLNRRRGNWDAARSALERLRRLMPQNENAIVELATVCLLTKDNPCADKYFSEVLALNPDTWQWYSSKAYNYLAWGQPLSRLRSELAVAATNGGADSCHVILAGILADAAEREWSDLLARRATAPDCANPGIGRTRYPIDLYAALAYRELDRAREAEVAIAAAQESLDEIIARSPDHMGAHAAIGLVHALAGRREEALAHGQKAMRLRPISEDAFQGSEPVQVYVRTLAQLGEPEDLNEALERLEQLLAMPASITVAFVRNDPFMEPIVAHPGFQALEARYPADSADGAGQ